MRTRSSRVAVRANPSLDRAAPAVPLLGCPSGTAVCEGNRAEPGPFREYYRTPAGAFQDARQTRPSVVPVRPINLIIRPKMQTPSTSHATQIGDKLVSLPWRALQVLAGEEICLVLLDPDEYLPDPAYQDARQKGAPAIRNLWAFTPDGEKLWEAEFPQASDYYYRIVATAPPVALSFSSWRCGLAPATGKIRAKEFLK